MNTQPWSGPARIAIPPQARQPVEGETNSRPRAWSPSTLRSTEWLGGRPGLVALHDFKLRHRPTSAGQDRSVARGDMGDDRRLWSRPHRLKGVPGWWRLFVATWPARSDRKGSSCVVASRWDCLGNADREAKEA